MEKNDDLQAAERRRAAEAQRGHLAAVAARDGPAWQRLMPFAQLRCQSLLLLLKCGFKLAFNAPIAPVAELASNSATHSLAALAAGPARGCRGGGARPPSSCQPRRRDRVAKKASQAVSAAQRQSLSETQTPESRHKVVLQR